jgi:hypothetical protein
MVDVVDEREDNKPLRLGVNRADLSVEVGWNKK